MFFPRMLGRGVRFAATESTEPANDATPKNPRWIQVAYEGDFVYRGKPIRFDRALFELLIRNFREHPTYKANPGTSNVVHFDYEHASEMDPREGSIPSTGVPAPAWALDLEVREGENGAELWSLTKLGPTILEQITTDPPEYQWTSVAIAPKYPNPNTGEDQGPTLTSIAFTNDPFLQGMVPISIAASMTVWVDKAESPEQARIGLCEIFGLPIDSDASVVAEHLQRFSAMLTGGVELEGVDLEGMLGSLRRLFGLPTLATREEVLSAANAAVPYDPNVSPRANAGTTAETQQMELSKKLAATFRVNEHDETILAAAEKAQSSLDAMDTLMGMLGAPDFQAAITAAKGLVEKTSGMGEIVAQLAAAMERIGKVDGEDADAEAEAVVASRVVRMGLAGNAAKVAADELRPAIVAMRRSCIDKNPAEQERKLAEFRKTYPLPEAERALLTRRIFAGPGGAQFGLRADDAGNLHPAPVAQPVTTSNAPRSDGRDPERVALCRDFDGPNTTAKAVAYLKKERPGFSNLDPIAQVKRAGEWLRASN